MTILFAIALLMPAMIALASLRRVPQGEAWTVHRCGRYVRTLQPGLHAIWPLLDRIARQVQLTGHHIELPARVFGTDNASADLYYQILDPMPSGNVLESVDEMVLRQADEALSKVAAQHSGAQAEWTVTTADALKTELNGRLGGMGLRIIRCALHAG